MTETINAANAFLVVVTKMALFALALQERIDGGRFVAEVAFMISSLCFLGVRFDSGQFLEAFDLAGLKPVHSVNALKISIDGEVIFVGVLIDGSKVEFAGCDVASSARLGVGFESLVAMERWRFVFVF